MKGNKMENFAKNVRIGTTATYGGRRMSVYVQIRYKNGELSISGVEGPLPSGNCLGSCGQIDMHWDVAYLTSINYAPGWDYVKARTLQGIWSLYHLNYMQAGCEHQRALGWTSYKDHPSEPCPVCGYEYGTAWQKMEVPESVLQWLKDLPDSDKEMPWAWKYA